MKLSEKTHRKFEEVIECSGWEILSHDGWHPIKSSNKTIEYEVYEVLFDNGVLLECADTHILMDVDMEEVFAKDSEGKKIHSKWGDLVVISVTPTGRYENMYDLSVDSDDHTYYTDGVLSHNTTTFGIDVLHDTIFNQDYKVGITSYKLSNVKDYMDRIKYAYENLPFWMKPAVKEYNKQNIVFINDSSIVSQVTGETTFRGLSLNRIISDELAFVKPAISEEFVGSLLPSMSANGDSSTTRLDIISTPKGTEGVFPSIWFGAVNEINGFAAVEVAYEEIPGRTPEFERQMVEKMGRDKFDQEFKNKFIGSGGTLISSRFMEAIKTREPTEKLDDLELFINREDIKGKTVALACDVSEGVGEDYHCMQLMDVTTFEQIGEWTNNLMSQSQYASEIIKTIEFLFKNGAEEVYYTFEANGIGQGLARLLESANNSYLDQAMLISETTKEGLIRRSGILQSNPKKIRACGTLKDLIESHRFKINSKKLLTELKFFVKKGAGFAAEQGAHDDRVTAVLLLMLMMEELVNYEESVDETINTLNEEEETWGISF